MEFGLPARTFSSFSAASKEAAISRLYGGIHFRDAIENGVKEGEQIGKYIITRAPGKKENKSAGIFRSNINSDQQPTASVHEN
jgi:hypothetical protein